MPPTEEELNKAAETLAKLKPGFLPQPIFFQVARLAVTAAIELIVFRKNQGQTEVFLTGRDSGDPFWPGMLHIPGVVLLATDKLGDDLRGPLDRLLENEFLETELKSKPTPLMVRFRQTERGRELVRIFLAEGDGGDDKDWYSISTLKPEKLMLDHYDLIAEAVKNFE